MAGNRLPDVPTELGVNPGSIVEYLRSLVSAIQPILTALLQNYQPYGKPYLLQPVTVAMIVGAAFTVKPGKSGASVFVTNPNAGAGGTQPRPAYWDGSAWRFYDDNTAVA